MDLLGTFTYFRVLLPTINSGLFFSDHNLLFIQLPGFTHLLIIRSIEMEQVFR